MSSCLEFEGKAVEHAVQKASEELNIPKDKLKYNVVSHGSSGIFGLVGVKKAKICVFLPDEAEEEKEPEQKERNRPRRRKNTDRPAAKSPAPPVQEVFNDPEDVPDSDTPDSDTEDIPDDEPDDSDETFVKVPRPAPKPFVPVDLSLNAVIMGKEALQRIVDFITTGARIDVKNGEDRLEFNVEGGDTGVLIGKRGQTLEAIQYLIEKIVNKNSEERIRIQVDVEGYLQTRKINLESLARRLADKSKHSGKPSTLGQMNAHDRRIIHLALKDDSEVRTQSMGDGFYRKLVIFPKRKNFRRKKMY
ncbi:MAG: RNA-binding cell elongation regulator Jag/EloR [Desulfococcaceae bacterium]